MSDDNNNNDHTNDATRYTAPVSGVYSVDSTYYPTRCYYPTAYDTFADNVNFKNVIRVLDILTKDVLFEVKFNSGETNIVSFQEVIKISDTDVQIKIVDSKAAKTLYGKK